MLKVWAHMTLLAIFEALVGANAIWETTVQALLSAKRSILFHFLCDVCGPSPASSQTLNPDERK